MPEQDDITTGSTGQLEAALSIILASGVLERLPQVGLAGVAAGVKTAVGVDTYGQLLVNPGAQDRARDNIAVSTAITSVAASATTVVLLAANLNVRRGAAIFNESSAICYLALAATASATAYTVQLSTATGNYFEVPFGYQGAISALWASATGNARITEFL